MATIPSYVYIGNEQITGGESGVKPSTGIAFSATGSLTGLALMMSEYQRVVPSGADGVNGGVYSSYFDGAYTKAHTASAGGTNTISVATATFKAGYYVGRTVTITAGTGAGQSRTISANTTTQITTSTNWTTPPDNTSVFNVGAGWTIQFHYAKSLVLVGNNGDNWFEFESITPNGMLMQRLGQLHGNTSPGFRMLKIAGTGGIATWRIGGGNGNLARTKYADMAAIEEAHGDTLAPRAIFVDAAAADIAAGNIAFQTDLEGFIDDARTTWGSSVLIVIVSPHPQTLYTSRPGSALAARGIIRDVVAARKALGDANLTIYDMSWGQFAWRFGSPITVAPTDPLYFDLPTVVQSGIGLFNVMQAHYAPAITAPQGRALPAVVIVSDSQFVGFTVNPLLAFYSGQPSLIGLGPSTTTKDNVWIWDDAVQQLVPYDVMANSNTYGAAGGMGPDVSLPRKLIRERYPQGVVLFKYAKGGVALTPEAVSGGATGYLESGGTIFADMTDKWTKCKVSALQTLNRNVDSIGALISLGENDVAIGSTSTNAFVARSGQWVDDFRDVFTTRVDGVLPMVWMQGGPPATEVSGGSVFGTAENRNAYRTHLLALEAEKDAFKVIRNTGIDPDRYEYMRDFTHYGGETLLKIGDKAAEVLLEIIASDPAVGTGADNGGTDSTGTDSVAVDDVASGSSSDSVAPPTSTQQDELQQAMFGGAGIKRYRTPSGLEVEMESADETKTRLEYARLEAARRSGLRQTLVRFD